MFFIFSKLLYFIIQPINWLVGCLLLCVFTKNEKRRRKSLYLSLFLAVFFTNHFIFNLFMNWWELDTQLITEIEQPYEVGVLLGGFSNFYQRPNADRHNFSERGNRFFQTLELYKSGKIKKILVTGGSGNILDKVNNEAVAIKDFMLRIGIPENDIIIEPKARNTYENGLYTKEIINTQYKNASLLLITSAWHMRRSKAVFDKAGLKYTPFSVDHIGETVRWHPQSTLIPDRRGFYRWEVVIKEIVGYIFYKLKGYI